MPSVIVFVFSEKHEENKNAFDIFPGSVIGAPVGTVVCLERGPGNLGSKAAPRRVKR